jgi:hypothetical protein
MRAFRCKLSHSLTSCGLQCGARNCRAARAGARPPLTATILLYRRLDAALCQPPSKRFCPIYHLYCPSVQLLVRPSKLNLRELHAALAKLPVAGDPTAAGPRAPGDAAAPGAEDTGAGGGDEGPAGIGAAPASKPILGEGLRCCADASSDRPAAPLLFPIRNLLTPLTPSITQHVSVPRPHPKLDFMGMQSQPDPA